MYTNEDTSQRPLVRRGNDLADRNVLNWFRSWVIKCITCQYRETQEIRLGHSSPLGVRILLLLILIAFVTALVSWALICHFGYCQTVFFTPIGTPDSNERLHGPLFQRINILTNVKDVSVQKKSAAKRTDQSQEISKVTHLESNGNKETKRVVGDDSNSNEAQELKIPVIQTRLDSYSMMNSADIKRRPDGFFYVKTEDVNFLSYHFHSGDPRSALPELLTSVDSAGEDPIPVHLLAHVGELPTYSENENEIDEELTYSEPCGENCWILRTARDATRMLTYLAVQSRLLQPQKAESLLAGTSKVLFEEAKKVYVNPAGTEAQGSASSHQSGWIPGYHNFGLPNIDKQTAVSTYSPPSPPVPLPRGALLPSIMLELRLREQTSELRLDSPLVSRGQVFATSIPSGDKELDDTLWKLSNPLSDPKMNRGIQLNMLPDGIVGIETIHWPLVFNRTTNAHHLLGEPEDTFEMPPLLIPNHYRAQSNNDAFQNLKVSKRVSHSLPLEEIKGYTPIMDIRAENRLAELQFLRSPFILRLQSCQSRSNKNKCFRNLVISSEGYAIMSDPVNDLQINTPLILVPGAPCHYGLAKDASLAALKNAKHPKDTIQILNQFERKKRTSTSNDLNPAASDSSPSSRIARRKTIGIILSQLFGYGAFHWLVECLPRIVYLKPLLRVINHAGSFAPNGQANSDLVFREFEAFIHVPRDFVSWRGTEPSRVGVGNSGISTLVRRSLTLVLASMGINLPDNRIVAGDVKFDMAYLPPATSCGRVSPIAGPLMRTVLQHVVRDYRRDVVAKSNEKGLSNTSKQFDSGLIFIQRKGKRELLQWKTVTSAFRKVLPQVSHLPFSPRSVTWTMAHNPPPFEVVMDHFFEAKAVVAPHGAGMANSLVSPSGLIVFEFTASDWKPGNCYQMLAWYLRHRWWGISPKVNDRERFMRLDQEELERAVRGFSHMVHNPNFTSISSEQPV